MDGTMSSRLVYVFRSAALFVSAWLIPPPLDVYLAARVLVTIYGTSFSFRWDMHSLNPVDSWLGRMGALLQATLVALVCHCFEFGLISALAHCLRPSLFGLSLSWQVWGFSPSDFGLRGQGAIALLPQ